MNLPLRLVERLRHADDFALHGLDRHAQDVVGGEAGLLVDGTVEACVGIGVVDDQWLAAGIDIAGDAARVEDADFTHGDVERDA